jgi:hypothetical protein
MKKITLLLSVLIFAAAAADARGGGGRGGSGGRSGGRGFSGSRGGFSRPLTRPSFSRSTSGFSSHTGFAASRTHGRSSFANASRLTGGTTPAGGGTGGSTPASAPAAAPAWATIGSKILTAGQQPVYSTASGGGTHSIDGGGFVAIDQSHAGDVGRGPGVTWGAPDRAQSSGSGSGGGSGGSSNGPAFDPSF